MPINFDYEVQKITADLKKVDGYLACERVVITNLKKHSQSGYDDLTIENFLKKLSIHFGNLIETYKGSDNLINYRYALGFINTLLNMPAWKSWIKEIGI